MSSPWTRIEIGGTVHKAAYEKLVSIADCNDLRLTPQHPLVLEWDECSSEALQRVFRFCFFCNLPYFVVYDAEGMDRWCEWWKPGMQFSSTPSPVSYSDGQPVIGISDLLRYADDHATLKELIARHTPPDLPPFVIEG